MAVEGEQRENVLEISKVYNPLLDDGKALLSAFIQKQSVHFSDFKDTWKEDMHFYLVYW